MTTPVTLSEVAAQLEAAPMLALAWLRHRSPNILLIPGTSSLAHLREYLAGHLQLSAEVLAELDGIAAGVVAAH